MRSIFGAFPCSSFLVSVEMMATLVSSGEMLFVAAGTVMPATFAVAGNGVVYVNTWSGRYCRNATSHATPKARTYEQIIGPLALAWCADHPPWRVRFQHL